MKVFVPAEFSQIKNGVAARSVELGLAGHGKDAPRAIDSLHRGVLAYCRGLERANLLRESLTKRGIRFEEDGLADIISLEILPVGAG